MLIGLAVGGPPVRRRNETRNGPGTASTGLRMLSIISSTERRPGACGFRPTRIWPRWSPRRCSVSVNMLPA